MEPELVTAATPLDKFVGQWVGLVTVTKDGRSLTHREESTFSWVLGGQYLQEIGAYGDTSFHGMWQRDPDHGYRSWYFIAPHGLSTFMQFTWHDSDQAFHGFAVLQDGMRIDVVDRFLGPDEYEWEMTMRDSQGCVISKTVAHQQRAR